MQLRVTDGFSELRLPAAKTKKRRCQSGLKMTVVVHSIVKEADDQNMIFMDLVENDVFLMAIGPEGRIDRPALGLAARRSKHLLKER